MATRPQTQEPTAALAQYKKDGLNVIASDDRIHAVSDRHRVDFSIISVAADPKRGEVYPIPGRGGEMGLGGTTLNRIALAAGIVWDAEKTGPDMGSMTRDYVLFRAVGYMTGPSGETLTLTGTKEIDMEVLAEEIRQVQARKLSGDRSAIYDDLTPDQMRIVDRSVVREMVEIRKNRMSLAESKAKNRAIRSIGLKTSYTVQELQSPFVIPRIVPDVTDPANARRLRSASAALWDTDEPEADENGDMAVDPFGYGNAPQADGPDFVDGPATDAPTPPETPPQATHGNGAGNTSRTPQNPMAGELDASRRQYKALAKTADHLDILGKGLADAEAWADTASLDDLNANIEAIKTALRDNNG